MWYPANICLIHAALIQQILQQAPYRIVRERGHDRGIQAEATLESAGDIVLAAAFADLEIARGRDAAIARIEANHYFTETQ